MKTSELLNMDYYADNNRDIFQKVLRKIKPFEKYSMDKDIAFDLLEKYIYKAECKYDIMINYICPVYIPNERLMYSATIRKPSNKNIYQTIHASSIYELFCKISIFYCSEIKNNHIGLKDWSRK